MTKLLCNLTALRVARLILIVFVTVTATPAALAEPVKPVANLAAPRTLASQSQDPVSVTLETSSTAIPVGGDFGLTVALRSSESLPYAQTRIQIFRPSGRLIFQRTRIEQDLKPGEMRYSFTRGTADLGLRPGAYPVEVSTRYTFEGATKEVVLEGDLLVYDSTRNPVATVFVVRVSGQPLAGPSGLFVSDPGLYTGARDNVDSVSRLVLSDPQVRISLAVSPMLLEEWKRISGGYEFASPEGVQKVPSDSPVAREFDATLQLLRQALDTGRLEIMALGYSDPDLSELAAHELISDVGLQYQAGLSAIFASLESTPSPGTASAGGCVPPDALRRLSSEDVSYTVVDASCARSKDATAASGAYKVSQGEVVALVADAVASRSAVDSDTAGLMRRLFDRHVESGTRRPTVVSISLAAASDDADSLARSVRAVLAEEWTTVSLARDAASAPRGRVSLTDPEVRADAPRGYWSRVVSSRRWAEAYASAMGPANGSATTAVRDSLVAECSAWADPDGTWAFADRGRGFAEEAESLSRGVLEKIGLTVQSVTLAASKGSVPCSVSNGSNETLEVRVVARSLGGLVVTGPAETTIELPPQESFLEVPVDLQSSLAGQLRVQVYAGKLLLDQDVVTVRASYLDRLAVIGGIVILLGILLAFIIRRVRSADTADANKAQYTGDETGSGEEDA